MWPTSIAVWKRERAAAVRAAVALVRLRGCRRSAAAKSRPASTPRRCQPVRFAPATNWPSRSVSSAIDLALEADRAERARIGAERGADLVLGRRPDVAAERRERASRSSSRSSPRTSASTTVPSSFVTGIAFDVAAGSMPRNSASASIVVTPGVSISSGASSRARELGRARDAARDLEVGGVVAVLAGDERVLARARTARGSRPTRCRPSSPTRPARRSTRARSARRSGGRRASCARKLSLEPGLVAVERVRVLHDELADAEQAAARARLVAVLRLEVVPGLRQLACSSAARARGR